MSAKYPDKKRDGIIYVVGFEIKTRTEIAQALAGLAWPVLSYPTAGEFLTRLKCLHRGCIVANLAQGEMSIAELLQELATNRIEYPVILLTHDLEIPEAVSAMRAGVYDVQALPIVERILRRLVQAVIENPSSSGKRTVG